MPRPPPIAAFVHKNCRKIALTALFISAVVLSVSFVANTHGVNRLALEQRGIHSHMDERMTDKSLGRPSLQAMQGTLDEMVKGDPNVEGRSKDSLEDAQNFVDKYGPGSFGGVDSPAAPAQKLFDEYGAGSFSSVADSPAAIAAPHHDAQAYSSASDGLALAPPLPGSVEPAYTSLSAHWVPMKAASHLAAVLASSGSQCFDVKNLKKFLPPGFGSVLKSAKKGSNPLDKFLTKAMLPTFGELQVPSPASTSQPNRSNVAAGCREVRSIHSQSAQSCYRLPQDRAGSLGDHRQVHDQPCEYIRQVPVQPQHACSFCRAQSRAHG